MTGFRIGYIIGNEKIIKAFKLVKDNMDSGQFIPIQKCAITALKDKEFIHSNCNKILRRHHKFNKILQLKGIKSNIPKATFYQLIKIPKQVIENDNVIVFNTANEFSMFLLKQYQIMTIPYDKVNSVRFSMTFSADTIEQEDKFFNEFEKRIKNLIFIY